MVATEQYNIATEYRVYRIEGLMAVLATAAAMIAVPVDTSIQVFSAASFPAAGIPAFAGATFHTVMKWQAGRKGHGPKLDTIDLFLAFGLAISVGYFCGIFIADWVFSGMDSAISAVALLFSFLATIVIDNVKTRLTNTLPG